MAIMQKMYGVIDETGLSLLSPRAIDEGPFRSLAGAFEAASEMAEGGREQCSIVLCRFSERHECWVEVVGGGVIEIDCRDAGGLVEEEDEDEA